MAFQGQVNYKIKKGSRLGGKYGTDIALNFSRITSIENELPEGTTTIVSGTDGYTSSFLKFGDELYFQDFNLEVQHKFGSKFKLLVSYLNLNYNIAVIEGHPEDSVPVKAHILIADMTYKFDQKNALKIELQHLGTKQDEGDWLHFLAEYTVAPKWFFTVSDQYNYGNPDKDRRYHYPTVAAGYTAGSSRVSLSYGKQREGILCVGGVCRPVPASNGFAVTITSSF
jgi:hypothetical protein